MIGEEAVGFLHFAGGRDDRGGHDGGPQRQDGGLVGGEDVGPPDIIEPPHCSRKAASQRP